MPKWPVIEAMFIVFDGVDGSGKSTQLELCRQWLEQLGRAVCACRDPGSTPLGNQIRQLLLNRGDTEIGFTGEMFLFMAARAQLVEEVIQPALQRGEVVLCDRFLLSTVVYQGHAGQLDPQTIWKIGQVATGGLGPHLTLVLDVPIETSMQRIGHQPDSLESRGATYLEKVRSGYVVEADKDTSIHLIDGGGAVTDVQAEIRTTIEPILNR